MPDDFKPWRWVPGDDKDPAETWLLVEGDGPLPGPRVVLTCGQVDAIDQAEITAGRKMLAIAEEVAAEYDKGLHNITIGLAVALRRMSDALAAAKGGGDA